MNKLPIFSAALTVCLLFSACGIREASPPSSFLPAQPHSDAPVSEMPSGSSPAGDPALSESGQEPEEEAAEPSQEPKPSKTETQVSLDFGGITVLAEMEDSETTKAFLNRLPLTLSMDRYADREYYAAIPALPENGEAIPDFENGDITYYATGNSLAIFFGNAGNSHQAGLIRMGRITSDLAAFDSIGDSVEVTIGLAGEEGEREMQRMEKRILGKDLEVSAVGFGCMGMTHTFGAAADKKEMTRILQAAVEQGYTFFDIAEVYVSDDGSDEHNEDLVGAALKPYRDKVKIATKFGIAFKPGGGFLYDTRPEKIRESLETSLRRLQTDHIDLYYLHRYEPGSAIEEVAQVMGQLIREGKILHWGLSTVTEDIIRRAHAVCPVTAVQNIFSMLDRDTEKLLPALEELHIGLVTHCPLAKGFLTAAYDKNSVFPEGDWRGRMELFTEEGIQKRQAVLDLIGAKAQEKNATPAQISLAWLMGKRPWIVPIPGTRKMERMIENGGAANIHLTEAEIVEIDRKLDDFIGPVQ